MVHKFMLNSIRKVCALLEEKFLYQSGEYQ